MQRNGNIITLTEDNEIFVFGSNADGHHVGGAARSAMDNYGAIWGQGHGLQGRSYAIDTMSGVGTILEEAEKFIDFAKKNPQLQFILTPVGCGIAGYCPEEIAPMFVGVPDNVVLPEEFK